MKIKRCWNCGKEVPYVSYDKIDYIPECDECGVKYPEKPEDEALLSIYHDEYLKNRTDENFNRLFILLRKVTFNVIRYKLKSKSSYEQMDEIWDNVQWTLNKLVTYYKEKPDFKISTSFVQYIGKMVLYPLYNKAEKERRYKEISIHTPKFKNSSDENTKELYQYLSEDVDGGVCNIENKIDYEINKNGVMDKSLNFIKNAGQTLYDYSEDHKLRNCIYMILFYKFFIFGEFEDVVVKKIIESMDCSFMKKFEDSKDLYKKVLIECSNGDV